MVSYRQADQLRKLSGYKIHFAIVEPVLATYFVLLRVYFDCYSMVVVPGVKLFGSDACAKMCRKSAPRHMDQSAQILQCAMMGGWGLPMTLSLYVFSSMAIINVTLIATMTTRVVGGRLRAKCDP